MAFRPLKTESLLQKAIKTAAMGTPVGAAGLTPKEDLGTALFQTAQGAVGNLPENVLANPVTTATSGPVGVQFKSGAQGAEGIVNLGKYFMGKETKNKIKSEFPIFHQMLQPKTLHGQITGTIGNIAASAFPLAAPRAVGSALGKFGRAVGRVGDEFSPIGETIAKAKIPAKQARTLRRVRNIFESKKAPILAKEERVGKALKKARKLEETHAERFSIQKKATIQNARKTLKEAKDALDDEVKSLATKGKQEIDEAVSLKFKEKNAEFGEKLDSLSSTMTKEKLSDALIKAADDVDDIDVQKKLTNMADELLEGSILDEFPDEPLSARKVQQFIKRARNAGGRSELNKTVINKHMLDATDDTVEGLRGLKESHAPIYKLAKQAKKFSSESKIRRAARGGKAGLSKEDFSEISGVESELGTNVFGKARQLAQKSKKLADDLGVDEDSIKRIGSKRIERLSEELNRLGVKKKEIVSKAEKSARNIVENFQRKRSDLTEKQLRAIRNDAIVAGALSILGFDVIRKVIGRKL